MEANIAEIQLRAPPEARRQRSVADRQGLAANGDGPESLAAPLSRISRVSRATVCARVGMRCAASSGDRFRPWSGRGGCPHRGQSRSSLPARQSYVVCRPLISAHGLCFTPRRKTENVRDRQEGCCAHVSFTTYCRTICCEFRATGFQPFICRISSHVWFNNRFPLGGSAVPARQSRTGLSGLTMYNPVLSWSSAILVRPGPLGHNARQRA